MPRKSTGKSGDGEFGTPDALAAEVAVLRSTLEATADGILVVDSDGRIVVTNRQFAEMWGVERLLEASSSDEEVLAHALSLLEDPEAFRQKVRELYADTGAVSYDLLYFRDGRVVERHSRPHLVGGVPRGRVWCFRDISERVRLEGMLRQSQKLEAVGSLAGGIAHDFNNLLTVIRGHAEFLLEDVEPRAEIIEEIEEILSAVGSAASLTRQLLAFSRQQVMQTAVLDVNGVISGVEPMLRRVIGEDIEVIVNLAAEDSVIADPGQIEQAVMNLAINARDAMPRGGVLTISTTQRVFDGASDIVRGAAIRPGNYVLLTVADTGTGIAPEISERVFEPFFTTKMLGRGTGLGLATVYGIVTQSEGHVWFESTPGAGTTFTIALPSSGQSAKLGSGAGKLKDQMNRTATILVVEDEEGVRQLTRRILERRGHTVITAVSGPDALAIAMARGDNIDLIVSDVVMPEMNGTQLVDELRRICPSAGVIYMSGYTGDEVMKKGVMVAGSTFLQKPFTSTALVHAVREAIAAKGSRGG